MVAVARRAATVLCHPESTEAPRRKNQYDEPLCGGTLPADRLTTLAERYSRMPKVVIDNDVLLETLSSTFGYSEFRPHQREIIEHVLEGGSAFVLMPTGGGKSLCFQVPALLRPGTAIVVSPLISLMKDQVDALRANGVSAAYLNSSLSSRGRRRRREVAQLR